MLAVPSEQDRQHDKISLFHWLAEARATHPRCERQAFESPFAIGEFASSARPPTQTGREGGLAP